MKRVPVTDVAWKQYFRHDPPPPRNREELYYKTAPMFEEPAVREKKRRTA